MGIFAEYQPIYASHNIPTFPVHFQEDGKKKPAVTNYHRFGIPGSAQLALKLGEEDSIAFMAGKRTRIMSVDIDSTDETLWREAEKRYGPSPIRVRTPSGGVHFWYLYNGEARKVRPDPSIPIDLLGGGVMVAPPSKGRRGEYEFIHGSLDDLHKLRPAANIIEPPRPTLEKPASKAGLIIEGRNDALYRHLMQRARYCDDFETLLDVAQSFAESMIDRVARHPFTDAEIRVTAKSVWDITKRGDNRFGGQAHSILYNDRRDILLELGPDAFYLYTLLQKWSHDKPFFPCANGIMDHIPSGKWSRDRIRAARAALIDAGIIIEVKPASTGYAAIYKWG
ncbi:hypothetical protein [Alterinioella nitratireducens]|uniref:hypothetical protein n=1 Tax=Alterinioella nitratireducens TaxID=2735915 RepID=UPI0040591E87